MTGTLTDLKARIAKLQRAADNARAREITGVVKRIRKAIEHYDLTAADLGFDGTGPARPGRARSSDKRIAATARNTRGKRRGTGVIRFRDEAGNAWTGHGRRPQWFIDALKSGKKAEDLAVR